MAPQRRLLLGYHLDYVAYSPRPEGPALAGALEEQLGGWIDILLP